MTIPHKRADNDIADRLVKELKLVFIGSARYHYEGDFYNLPKAYPIVLFDLYGYVIINSEHELNCKLEVKKKVHIPRGIHRLPNYTTYKFTPECLKEEHEINRIENEKTIKSYAPFHALMGIYVKAAGTGSLQRMPPGYR